MKKETKIKLAELCGIEIKEIHGRYFMLGIPYFQYEWHPENSAEQREMIRKAIIKKEKTNDIVFYKTNKGDSWMVTYTCSINEKIIFDVNGIGITPELAEINAFENYVNK